MQITGHIAVKDNKEITDHWHCITTNTDMKTRQLKLQPEWQESTDDTMNCTTPVPCNWRDLSSHRFWTTWCIKSSANASTEHGTNHGQRITNCSTSVAMFSHSEHCLQNIEYNQFFSGAWTHEFNGQHWVMLLMSGQCKRIGSPYCYANKAIYIMVQKSDPDSHNTNNSKPINILSYRNMSFNAHLTVTVCCKI